MEVLLKLIEETEVMIVESGRSSGPEVVIRLLTQTAKVRTVSSYETLPHHGRVTNGQSQME